MLYRVRHVTSFSYTENVALAHNRVSSKPRETNNQECLAHHMLVDPEPGVVSRYRDAFGNWMSYFTLEQPHRELTVTLRSDVLVKEPPTPPPEMTVAQACSWDDRPQGIAARQFLFPSPHVRWSDAVRDYALQSLAPERSVVAGLIELNSRIYRDFAYTPGSTNIHTTVDEIFQKRKGVCQDFAHLGLAMVRALGLPGRYVSGYLLTQPPPGKPRLVGADASHAWFSVYLPNWGWLDLDPTNNCCPQLDHITQAWGRDYADVSPLRGVVLGGGSQSVKVSVDVQPLEASAVQ